MARLTMLIALTMQRNQLLNLLTQHGQIKILIERKKTSELRAEVIRLILAERDDDTN